MDEGSSDILTYFGPRYGAWLERGKAFCEVHFLPGTDLIGLEENDQRMWGSSSHAKVGNKANCKSHCDLENVELILHTRNPNYET